MTIKALLEEKAKTTTALKALTDAVAAQGFTYKDNQKAEIATHKARLVELDDMMDTAQAQIASEAKAAPAGFGIVKNDKETADASNQFGGKNGKVDREAVLMALKKAERNGRVDPSRIVAEEGRPFRTLGEQISAVIKAGRTGRVDQRLVDIGASQGASETISPDGGYLVQEEFMAPMLDNIIASGQIASLCSRVSTSSPGVSIPRLRENSRADGSRYGGINATWVNEGKTIPSVKGKFERVNVPVEKLAILMPITEELDQDAPFLAGFLNLVAGSELAFQLDNAIIRGSGQGAPLGILNSNAIVQTTKDSGQTANLTSANLFNMFGRVSPRSKRSMVWLANQELYPDVLALKDDSDRNLFLQSQNITNVPVDRLLGRPYIEVEQCEAPKTAGDIIAADLSQYLLVDRGGVQSDVSMHLYFDTAEQALRVMLRVGGVPLPSAPMTPYKGTKTLSPFVTLQAR